jgi:hypothetical protein
VSRCVIIRKEIRDVRKTEVGVVVVPKLLKFLDIISGCFHSFYFIFSSISQTNTGSPEKEPN